MNQVKQTLRRSGISIMTHLISLLGSFAAVLILAVINGSIGYLCAMSVTLFGPPERIRLSAITAGGSSAIFFKINTFGEEAFLECIEEIVSPYCH